MTLEHFINTIALEFDDVIPETISSESEFRNLEGWSSMLSLIIISKINKIYGVTITSQELAQSKTIDDLYKVALSKTQVVN
jgi:acyl carrier protein